MKKNSISSKLFKDIHLAKKDKFNAKKVVNKYGKFASLGEADRHDVLVFKEKNRFISDLKRQVSFPLLPKIYMNKLTKEFSLTIPLDKKEAKNFTTVKKATTYIADFTYYDQLGKFIVEDFKGKRTKEYIIKKKLMKVIHDIGIYETSASEKWQRLIKW